MFNFVIYNEESWTSCRKPSTKYRRWKQRVRRRAAPLSCWPKTQHRRRFHRWWQWWPPSRSSLARCVHVDIQNIRKLSFLFCVWSLHCCVPQPDPEQLQSRCFPPIRWGNDVCLCWGSLSPFYLHLKKWRRTSAGSTRLSRRPVTSPAPPSQRDMLTSNRSARWLRTIRVFIEWKIKMNKHQLTPCLTLNTAGAGDLHTEL